MTNRRGIYYWLVAAACIRSCGTDTVGCRNLIATCLSPCHILPSNYLEGMHFFDVNNTITYTTKFNLILRSLAPPQKVSPGITILRHRPRTYALKRTCTARARSCLLSGVLPHRRELHLNCLFLSSSHPRNITCLKSTPHIETNVHNHFDGSSQVDMRRRMWINSRETYDPSQHLFFPQISLSLSCFLSSSFSPTHAPNTRLHQYVTLISAK